MKDSVSIAARFAIKRAKRRKSSEVDENDLLVGLLRAISRFDIAKIGPLTIDLEDIGEAWEMTSQDVKGKGDTQKVAYSSHAVAVFERAAHIARKDSCPKVKIVHLLAAFAHEGNGLMAQLKEKYGFSSTEWRSALIEWKPMEEKQADLDSQRKSPAVFSKKQFFSPDEAAEFLDVHIQTIRGYIRSGKLPALRLAGERALRIQRADLLALLEPYKPEEK